MQLMELQFADGTILSNAVRKDLIGVLDRVKALTEGGRRLSRVALLEALTDQGVGSSNTPVQKHLLNVGPLDCGSITVDAQGHTRVVLCHKLTPGEFAEYTTLHSRFLQNVHERRASAQAPASPRIRP